MRVTIQFWPKHEPTLHDANTTANAHDADFFLHGIGIYRVGVKPVLVTHRDNLAMWMEDVVSGRKS